MTACLWTPPRPEKAGQRLEEPLRANALPQVLADVGVGERARQIAEQLEVHVSAAAEEDADGVHGAAVEGAPI